MKVFSKFLAVTLALFMVLALIPFSVFAKASEPWLEVEGNEGVDAPVLTVKVDAKALMDLLRADGSDSLLDTLQSGISLDLESLTEVFTATELFEIVPREEWLKILPVEDFVESVGVEEVRAALDLETLAPVIDWDTVLDLVGGDVEKAKEYISVENGVLVVENLEKLFDDIGFSEVLSVAPVETLAEQLSADELFDLVTKIDLKPYAKQLLALVLRKTLSNVDELVIDGTLVAAEDNKGMLEVYASNLLSVINKIRPSLDDIANTEDGKLISALVSLKYTVNGTEEQKSKDLILEVVLDGDLTAGKNVAKKLSAVLSNYVSYSYNNGTLTADVTLPEGFAEFFKSILDTETLDAATKQKLLNLANVDGNELVGVLEGLTAADLVELLGAIDVEALGELLLQQAYVQKCLEIASQFTGIDMTGMDVKELLDSSATLPGVDQICAKIQETYNVDVYAALEKYETTGELYAAALEGAKNNTELFKGATNLIVRTIKSYLPESAMDLSLMDRYNGNGNFTFNESIAFDAKEIVAKALSRIVNWMGLDVGSDVLEALLSQVSKGTQTLKLDLSVQVAGVYSITYKDKETNNTLFTAFLPAGADLSVFLNKDAIGGYEITGWVDENGESITVMPARDVVVYADYEGGGEGGDDEEEKQEVTVTFLNRDGSVLGTVTVFEGDTLAEKLEAVDGFEALVEVTHSSASFLYDRFEVVWRVYNAETGAAGSRWMPSRTVVTENITVIADTAPNYYLDIEDVDYDVELVEEGTSNKFFTLTIHEDLPEAFVLDMDFDHLLQLAAMSYNVKLDVIVGEKQYTFFSMDDALLGSLRKEALALAQKKVTFHFNTVSANAAGSLYAKDENASFFTFEIQMWETKDSQTSSVVYDKNFVSDLYITLPYDKVLASDADASCATRVHLIYADGSRELVEYAIDTNGFVTIKAPHFSEYVVSNEYKLNMSFVSTEASDPTAIFGAWKGFDAIDSYFPAGCEIKAIPAVSAENVNNYTWVSTVIAVNGASKNYNYGELFVMPAGVVDVTVTVKPRECNVYYYVLGTQLYKDTYFFYQTVSMRGQDDPAVMEKDPDGKPSTYQWVGFDASLIGVCDIYAHAKWNGATYSVQFIGRDGSPVATMTFDEATYYTIVPPAVPLEAGYVGAWSAYDLTSVFGKEDGYVLKVNAVYTEAAFKIFSDGIVTVVDSAKFGDTVTVTAPDKAGYDKVILVTLANQSTQTVEGGVFVMPASEVYVDVVYVPYTFTYTINGWTYEGKMNETVTFDIALPRGKVLTTVPEGCVLADVKLEADGTLILTYSFKLLEDGTAINWKWNDSKYKVKQIINGQLFNGDGVPVSTNDDAVFLGWTSIVADNLQFAIFGIHEEAASWVWLWILIVLIVLIGIIVLFYLLHKAGKIGANAFVRAILWIVNLFFTACIAIAELGLKVVGLFKKNSDAE